MYYQTKNFNHLLGINGFSDKLLKNHFSLYEGYIKNANKLLKNLREMLEEGKTDDPAYSEIKRRLGFELNGIKLHEYYFGNMAKDGAEEPGKDSPLFQKVSEEFGSYQNWTKSFKAVGTIRGVGWAIAIYDPSIDLIINTWVDEHHMGHVVGTVPILVMDLWEHAMLLDYGSDRAAYIDAFFKVIDWSAICGRFEEASMLKPFAEISSKRG